MRERAQQHPRQCLRLGGTVIRPGDPSKPVPKLKRFMVLNAPTTRVEATLELAKKTVTKQPE